MVRWRKATRGSSQALAALYDIGVGFIPAFVGGLIFGAVWLAVTIGVSAGLLYLGFKRYVGPRSSAVEPLSPEQVSRVEAARARGLQQSN